MSPDTTARRRLHPAIKAVIVVAVLAVLGYLFVRSVTDVRAEPYEMAAAHLTGWTLASDTAQDAEDAAIALRAPTELTMNLFRQLFRRQMESLSSSTAPGIVLALRRELAPNATAAQLLALAREVGLDRARPSPQCVAYRRVSSTGVTRQLYFVWFSLAEYGTFRERLTPLARDGYRAEALSPVMLIAAEPGFAGWQPVVVDEAQDCVAPVTVR